MRVNFPQHYPKTPRPARWFKYAGIHFITSLKSYSANTKDPVWFTDRGEVVPIKSMHELHLRNVLSSITDRLMPKYQDDSEALTFLYSWEEWILHEMGEREVLK